MKDSFELLKINRPLTILLEVPIDGPIMELCTNSCFNDKKLQFLNGESGVRTLRIVKSVLKRCTSVLR